MDFDWSNGAGTARIGQVSQLYSYDHISCTADIQVYDQFAWWVAHRFTLNVFMKIYSIKIHFYLIKIHLEATTLHLVLPLSQVGLLCTSDPYGTAASNNTLELSKKLLDRLSCS